LSEPGFSGLKDLQDIELFWKFINSGSDNRCAAAGEAFSGSDVFNIYSFI
jgi:hypothetical protein